MAAAGACGHESPPELVRLTHRDAFSVFFNVTWSYYYYSQVRLIDYAIRGPVRLFSRFLFFFIIEYFIFN